VKEGYLTGKEGETGMRGAPALKRKRARERRRKEAQDIG